MHLQRNVRGGGRSRVVDASAASCRDTGSASRPAVETAAEALPSFGGKEPACSPSASTLLASFALAVAPSTLTAGWGGGAGQDNPRYPELEGAEPQMCQVGPPRLTHLWAPLHNIHTHASSNVPHQWRWHQRRDPCQRRG